MASSLFMLQVAWRGQYSHQEIRNLLLERSGPEIQVAERTKCQDIHCGNHYFKGKSTFFLKPNNKNNITIPYANALVSLFLRCIFECCIYVNARIMHIKRLKSAQFCSLWMRPIIDSSYRCLCFKV